MCSTDTVNIKQVGTCNGFIKDGIENCFNMNEYYRQWNNDDQPLVLLQSRYYTPYSNFDDMCLVVLTWQPVD